MAFLGIPDRRRISKLHGINQRNHPLQPTKPPHFRHRRSKSVEIGSQQTPSAARSAGKASPSSERYICTPKCLCSACFANGAFSRSRLVEPAPSVPLNESLLYKHAPLRQPQTSRKPRARPSALLGSSLIARDWYLRTRRHVQRDSGWRSARIV